MDENERRRQARDNLIHAADRLGRMELDVLVRIAGRLVAGRNQYGDLTPNKKNWLKEAQEEAMDMAVYLSCFLEDTKF